MQLLNYLGTKVLKTFTLILLFFSTYWVAPAYSKCPSPPDPSDIYRIGPLDAQQDLDSLRYMDKDELLDEHLNAIRAAGLWDRQCALSGTAGHSQGCKEANFCKQYTGLTKRVARKEHSLIVRSYSEQSAQYLKKRRKERELTTLKRKLAKSEKKYLKAKKSFEKKPSEKNTKKFEEARDMFQNLEQTILSLEQEISSIDTSVVVKNQPES